MPPTDRSAQVPRLRDDIADTAHGTFLVRVTDGVTDSVAVNVLVRLRVNVNEFESLGDDENEAARVFVGDAVLVKVALVVKVADRV